MGGNAFTDLVVPRLPHDLYNLIRDQCHDILQNFYEDVVTPSEAPSKIDHGDIDFMTARPKAVFHGTITPDNEIAKRLGAVKFKHTANSKTIHFAIPISDKDAIEAGLEDAGKLDFYAQVDVHVVPDPDYFAWELFQAAYGDLMQIIGVLNRPIGLTANDRGLFLRIPEIEPHNRKKAMVFLTSDPHEMLSLLRLSIPDYEAGFSTNEEVFEWCLSGGLYSRPRMHDETSNDRQRIKKRNMFTDCMRRYYPEHAERLWPPTRRVWTRDEVLEEALTVFPDARPVYEAAMKEYVRKEFEAGVLADMRVVGADSGAGDKEIDEVVRGSKRFVDHLDGEWLVTGASTRDTVELIPQWMKRITTTDEKEAFMVWLRGNWKDIRERERERMRVGYQQRNPGKSFGAWSETTGSVV